MSRTQLETRTEIPDHEIIWKIASITYITAALEDVAEELKIGQVAGADCNLEAFDTNMKKSRRSAREFNKMSEPFYSCIVKTTIPTYTAAIESWGELR